MLRRCLDRDATGDDGIESGMALTQRTIITDTFE